MADYRQSPEYVALMEENRKKWRSMQVVVRAIVPFAQIATAVALVVLAYQAVKVVDLVQGRLVIEANPMPPMNPYGPYPIHPK